MSNKNVVYSVNIGDKDILLDPVIVDEGVDYLFFTDKPENCKSKVYKPIKIELPKFRGELLNSARVRTYKPYKITPHIVPELQKYETSIYHDGNIQIVQSIIPLLNETKPFPFSAIWHNNGGISTDVEACIKGNKDFTELINFQYQRYLEDGYPKNRTEHWITGILIRKHMNPDVIEFDNKWIREIDYGSHRCQISLPYIQWKYQFPIHSLRSTSFNRWTFKISQYFNYCQHKYLSKTNESERIIYRYPLEYYVDRIKNNEYFNFVRYGDGEWIFYFKNRKQGQAMNSEIDFDTDLSDRLIKSINQNRESDSYIYGLQDLSVNLFGAKLPKLQWHAADVFHYASIDKKLLPFLEALKEKKLVFIGGKYLRKIKEILPYDHFIEIPEHNCHKEKDNILKAIRDYGKPAVYLFQCSVLSKVLIYELDIPDSFLIDAGSLFDPFVGKRSRTYNEYVIENGIIDNYKKAIK